MKTLAALFIAFFLTPAFGKMSASEVVRRADQARVPGFPHSLVCKVVNKGEAGDTNVFRVSVKNANVSLVEQTEPTRLKGRKLLMNDDNLWLITPTIKRPTRVSLEQRLTGEVANGDLARTAFADDYNAVEAGELEVSGHKAIRITLTAKTKNVTYAKIDYYVDQRTMLPVASDFYAISGKLLKRAHYSDFKTIFGRSMVTKISVEDAVQKDNRSVMVLSNYKKESFGASYFAKEALNP